MKKRSTRVVATAIFCLSPFMVFGNPLQNRKITYHTVEHKVASRTIYKFSRLAHDGRLTKVQDGKPGLVKKVFEKVTVDGHVVLRKLVKEEIIKPKDTIFIMDNHGFQISSRHEFARDRVMTLVATAYASPPGRHKHYWGRTRTGLVAKFGVVAVDPRVIPLGTLLYVEGYGFAKAADTGSAIKGHRIDLCYNSNSKADSFGVKKVRVHILRDR